VAVEGPKSRANQPFYSPSQPSLRTNHPYPEMEKYQTYKGLGRFGYMQQHHPDIREKPYFKDMLGTSSALDKQILAH